MSDAEKQRRRQVVQTRLGDILKLRKDVLYPQDKPQGLAKFVGLEHIESGTGVRLGFDEVETSRLTGRKPRFYAGDIVYGYLRPYLNKVWVAEFDGLCSVDQYVFAVDPAKACRDYVAWFMRSPLYMEQAPTARNPGQLPRIRTEEVFSVKLDLPELPDQERIVRLISEQMAAYRQAKEALEAQLAAIEEMPAALLRKTIEG